MKSYRNIRWLLIIAAVAVFISACSADDPAVAPTDDLDAGQGLIVHEMSTRRIVMTLTARELSWHEIELDGVVYRQAAYPHGALRGEIGEPAWPAQGRLLAVPHGAQALVSFDELDVEFIDDLLLAPVAAPQPDLDGLDDLPPTLPDAAAYRRDALAPTAPAELGDTGVIRGVSFQRLWLTNLQYNPVERRARLRSEEHTSELQ